MTKVNRGVVGRKRRKKILAMNKGFRGAASVLFRTAHQRYMKALKYSYRNRRQKKRDFRSLWIARLNAALHNHGFSYNEFVHMLKLCENKLNRKMLSQLCLTDSKILSNLSLYLFSVYIKKTAAVSLSEKKAKTKALS